MKKYRDLSVKTKVSVLLGIASFLALSLVCLLLLRPLRRFSLEDSSTIVRTSAIAGGRTVGERINRVSNLVRIYAGSIGKMAGGTESLWRHEVMDNLKTMFEYQVATDNLWCIFEPGVFGGADSLYAGKPGNTAAGVFVPWIVDGIQVTDVEERMGAFSYEEAKWEGREMITGPYTYRLGGKERTVFSVCAPIRVDGRFVGIAGTDFDILELHRQVDGLSNARTVGRLVTGDGTIITHPDPTQIGTLVDNGNQTLIQRLAENKMIEEMSVFEGREVYNIYVPVPLGDQTWYYAERIPGEDIYMQARRMATYLIFYCIIGLVMISLAGWYLMRPLMKSITGVTGIIRRLSLGHIDMDIERSAGRDELGTMTGELGELVAGLKRTTGFAQSIGEGNLDAEYRLLSADDALGNSLLEMRESLRKADSEQTIREEEEERRNWITAGLAKFAEILRRDNDDMEALSYNVISNMVKYMGINQGGIFILNEADNVLELKACYAFDRRKFAVKQIHAGEGLVGTCLLEGEPIYLTDIPREYINITSGLGDANPKALLISPLKLNDRIYGIIELASFSIFEPHKLEFVQKVSESIAATISGVSVNIRTNKLLEQTREQAEEMANQEEELRQNMEEMQATQEEMRRREVELRETLDRMEEVKAADAEKEHEMQQFHNAIYDSNNVIELSPDGFFTDVNQNLLNMWGADRAAFVGKHITAFVSEQAYAQTKAALDRGQIFEDVQTICTADGRNKTIRQRFIPLTDTKGRLQKVLMIGFDETFIDDSRRHEEELRQSMEELQATQEETRRREEELAAANYEAEQLQNMILITSQVSVMSPDGMVIDVNDNIINAFEGATRDTFVGKPMEAFIGKKELDAVMAHCTRGKMYEMVSGLPTGPGRITTFRQKFVPICDRDGKLLRVMMVANDETYIEEIRRHEEELRQSMEELQATQEESARREEEYREKANWYESMLDSFAGTPVSATDNDRNLTFLNKPALEILGKTKEEVIGKPCGEVWNVDICKDERCGIECLMHGRGKSKFSVGDRTFTTDGSYITDLAGKRIGHVEVVADVTEAEKLLAEAAAGEYALQQFRRMMFETCNVIEFSAEGLAIDINQNLLDIFDAADKTDFIGKHVAELEGEEASRKIWDDVRRGNIHDSTRRTKTAAGKTLTIRRRFMPVRDRDGNLISVFERVDTEKTGK